jgi:hypothetical protein
MKTGIPFDRNSSILSEHLLDVLRQGSPEHVLEFASGFRIILLRDFDWSQRLS